MQKKAKYLVVLVIFLVGLVVSTASLGKGTAQAQDFEGYVWWVPPRNSDPPSDLVAQLEEEVAAIVQAGHLAPYYFERGFTSREGVGGGVFWRGNVSWFNPGDIIYTLSYAMPYLSSDLQVAVKAYLTQELENYPPFERLGHPGSEWLLDGTRREPYEALPIVEGVNVWPVPPEPVENRPAIIENLYALWVYAHATNDWQYISDHWEEIEAVYEANKDMVSYGAIGGVIGYARMADHLGFDAIAQDTAQEAVSKMQAGLDFNLFVETANQTYPDNSQFTPIPSGWRAPVFFYLTPEVSRFLAENVALPVQEYLDDFTAENANSLWYVTKAGAQRDWGEQSYHGPERAWSIFMAKAYVMGEYREALQQYLDIPLCLGDLYYIQKLVAIIDAYSADDSTPPIISDVTVDDVTIYSATITWQTDEPATTQVKYGLDTNYGSMTPVISALTTSHRVTLVGLRHSTIYYFRVISMSAGGTTVSSDYTFTTPQAFEVFVPLIARGQ